MATSHHHKQGPPFADPIHPFFLLCKRLTNAVLHAHIQLVYLRFLQGLSTAQLDASLSSDPHLDVLTGFQLVDGALRCVVLEGPAAGTGMAVTVPAIAR